MVGETQSHPRGCGWSELPTAGLCREAPAMPAGIPAADVSAYTQPACWKYAQEHGVSGGSRNRGVRQMESFMSQMERHKLYHHLSQG